MDPVYNIKAIRGMIHEMKNNPGRFKGHRILYIHTGKCNAGHFKREPVKAVCMSLTSWILGTTGKIKEDTLNSNLVPL